MSLFEKAAITGIGETAHGRGLQQGSALSLQMQASLAAIADGAAPEATPLEAAEIPVIAVATAVRQPRQGSAQGLHGDSIIDTRMHFDIQLMYFPHDVPLAMGGTLLLPGSHFRRINEMDIARYQNFLGQIPMVCKAGTILVLHHGIWHCGRRNETEQVRYMFKVRLNPRVRQLRLWNTDDLDETTKQHKAIFTRDTNAVEDIQTILGRQEPWFEDAAGRLEVVNRIKLWRFLTGDNNFDVHYWLTRLENMPENLDLAA